MEGQRDSWNEWAKFVLEELKNLRGDLKYMESRNEQKMGEFWKLHLDMQERVNKLKIQAAVLGALVGGASGGIGSQVIGAIFNK